jgi:predicted AlkP superfamily phosphohydrolase/phosphomutase
MSFPAWSSFMTGLSPGRHGLFDFTQKVPGEYRIRFSNATDRRGESLFGRVARAGGRCLVLGIPATFPPEPLPGLLVAGFDSPVSAGSDARQASDPDLYRSVAARSGPWMQVAFDQATPPEERDDAWYETVAQGLLERIDCKRDFALEALSQLRGTNGGNRPELMAVVFSESDTVAHHFWRDHDPDSPRHDAAASAARRGAVAAVYERLDGACGELRAAFGEDAACCVMSDHGSGGAARRVVHLAGYLRECGLLTRSAARRASPRAGWDGLARSARDAALRALPPRWAEQIFRRARGAAARLESTARFGGFDWSRTAAFSEEANTQPGVWINLRGREAAGCVDPADYERVRDDVIRALEEWTLPGGGRVVERALRREELYRGPCVDRAPDVAVELALDAGYGLSLVQTPFADGPGGASPSTGGIRTLADDELAGGRGRGMSGTHRSDGIWIADGPGVGGLTPPRAIEDVVPTVLLAMQLAADVESADDALDGTARRPSAPYSDDEEAQVAERLRDLGYLE